MPAPPWKYSLRWLGLEFWLPLPVLGLMFWLGSGWLTEQVLRQSHSTTTRMVLGQPPQVQIALSVTVLAIEAQIHRRTSSTLVKVIVVQPALKEVVLELPFTDFQQVEAAIAQQVNLSPEVVRKLVRYHIKN